MRGAEFDDFARLLVCFAQIRVIVAQSKVVESRGPIGRQGQEKEHGGEQPCAHAHCAATVGRSAGVSDRDRDCRFSDDVFGNGHKFYGDPIMLQCTGNLPASILADRNAWNRL